MQKPYDVKTIETPKDIELIDNLFTILFKGVQGREIRTLKYTVTATWPTTGAVAEKELVFVNNTIDGVRLYTKISGVLKYIAFT